MASVLLLMKSSDCSTEPTSHRANLANQFSSLMNNNARRFECNRQNIVSAFSNIQLYFALFPVIQLNQAECPIRSIWYLSFQMASQKSEKNDVYMVWAPTVSLVETHKIL